jgi:hypothetical protein
MPEFAKPGTLFIQGLADAVTRLRRGSIASAPAPFHQSPAGNAVPATHTVERVPDIAAGAEGRDVG